MFDRYQDIEDLFLDELKGEVLFYFINWLIEKVFFLEIDILFEDEVYIIFFIMNDCGLSLNSVEMMKVFVIQYVVEEDRIKVNQEWQSNISCIKNVFFYDMSGMVNMQDVEFVFIWFCVKYVNCMCDIKCGVKDEDYEFFGDKFYVWVSNNVCIVMGFVKLNDYKNFVFIEMMCVIDVYL